MFPKICSKKLKPTKFKIFTRSTGCLLKANILEAIGRTPIIKINRLAPEGRTIYVKNESLQPSHSVKARLALAIIEDAESKGKLKPGQTVIEATSGNTGISLAMVCAVKGYPFIAVMSESFSIERRKLIKAYGAKIILTPASEKGSGMVKKAVELANKYGYFYCNQFDSPCNPMYHANTTAAEILDAFRGRNLDYFVTGYGTGGTFSGVSNILKVARPDCKLILTEPDIAPMVSKGIHSSHPIQGWTPDFIPATLDTSLHDEVELVSAADSIKYAQLLASKEGIFCGISSGANFVAAINVANKAPEGSVILTLLADTGERYLSTDLFKDVTFESDSLS